MDTSIEEENLRGFIRLWPCRRLYDEEYQYQTLPKGICIRILELLPGKGRDQLCCRLHPSNSEKVEDTYEAISYVWGDSTDKVSITCDNKRNQAMVNLAEVLLAINWDKVTAPTSQLGSLSTAMLT